MILGVFLLLSIICICYLICVLATKKKMHYILETILFILFGFSLLLVIFPSLYSFINSLIPLLTITLIILSCTMFCLIAISLQLYHQIEIQRIEITTLTQEIAFMQTELKELTKSKKKTKK